MAIFISSAAWLCRGGAGTCKCGPSIAGHDLNLECEQVLEGGRSEALASLRERAASGGSVADAPRGDLHGFPLEVFPAGARVSRAEADTAPKLAGSVFNLLARRNRVLAPQKLRFHADNGDTNEKALSSLH